MKRDAYVEAAEDMFARTNIPEAPWTIVEGNDKKRARLNCIAHLLEQLPYKETVHPPIDLPARMRNPDYLRLPVPENMIR